MRIRGKADIISLAPVYQLTNLISVFIVYTKLETVSQVKIKAPEGVRDEYKNLVLKAAEEL